MLALHNIFSVAVLLLNKSPSCCSGVTFFEVTLGKESSVNNCLTRESLVPQFKINLSAVPDLLSEVQGPQYTRLRLGKLPRSSVLTSHGRLHLPKHNYHNCNNKSKCITITFSSAHKTSLQSFLTAFIVNGRLLPDGDVCEFHRSNSDAL